MSRDTKCYFPPEGRLERLRKRKDRFTHGGKREGAGRKPAPYPSQLVKIQATPDEMAKVLMLTTRERTEAMLARIKGTGDERKASQTI